MQMILVSLDELWLKGKNQSLYVRALRKHVKRVVNWIAESNGKDRPELRLQNERFIIAADSEIADAMVDRIRLIPGISRIYVADRVQGDDFEEIVAVAAAHCQRLEQDKETTFAVRARRANKKFKPDSMTLAATVGSRLLALFPHLKVNLKNPQLSIQIRVLNDGVYVYSSEIRGVGGLPVGMSGKALCLLSGGFDSPVASYLMAKRGCGQDFAFFYAYPFVGEEVKEKIEALSKRLALFQNRCRLFVVPFGHIQEKISERCKPAYRTTLFRHFMLVTAQRLAADIHCEALITGDALGQVSSQTMSNMALLDASTELPILRPLLGFNKQEIIDLSREIGTHDISVLPHDDACSMFAAKNPVTRPHREYWRFVLEGMDLDADIDKAIADSEKIVFM